MVDGAGVFEAEDAGRMEPEGGNSILKMFKCLPNCGECCGVIPIDRALLDKHKAKMQVPISEEVEFNEQEVFPITEDAFCVFLNRKTKQCSIYEDRPEVCQKYGATDHPSLACPYLKPNGNRRSPAKQRQIQRIINHSVDGVLRKAILAGEQK